MTWSRDAHEYSSTNLLTCRMFRRQVACFRNPRHFASSVDRVLDTTVRAGFSGIRLCRAFVALLSEVYCRRLVRLCRNRQTTVERQESLNDLQFSHDLQKHILSSCWWWHWISYPWTIHTITHLSLSLSEFSSFESSAVTLKLPYLQNISI